MTNLTNTSNSTDLKQHNFDKSQKMTPNSNYFAGRFINRPRRASGRMR